MSGQYPWGTPFTPAQQAWYQQQVYAAQQNQHGQYPPAHSMPAVGDISSAQSYAAMQQHNMIMHQRSLALSNANAAMQAAQQRNRQAAPAQISSTASPRQPHTKQSPVRNKGQKRPREKAASSTGPVKVPQNLLQLVPSKYRYAFSVGDSEEDIQKWREARRRRFPSAANRAAADAQQAQKVERGELLAEANTGHMRSKRQAMQPSGASASATPPAPRPCTAQASAAATAAAGKGLVDYSSDSDSDTAPVEKPSTATAAASTSAPEASTASSLPLPAARGNDADTHTAAQSQHEAQQPATERPTAGGTGRPPAHKKNTRKGVVRGGEHLTASAVGSRAGTQRDASRGQRTQHRRGKQQRTSLLRQLLAGEMRKENSSVLQCIRYLRNNQYLADVPLHGKARSDTETDSEENSDSSSDSDSSSVSSGSSSE